MESKVWRPRWYPSSWTETRGITSVQWLPLKLSAVYAQLKFSSFTEISYDLLDLWSVSTYPHATIVIRAPMLIWQWPAHFCCYFMWNIFKYSIRSVRRASCHDSGNRFIDSPFLKNDSFSTTALLVVFVHLLNRVQRYHFYTAMFAICDWQCMVHPVLVYRWRLAFVHHEP